MNNLPGKYHFRQRQRNRLYEVVLNAVDDAARLDGIRRKDIAAKTGTSPSQISRWFSGPSNWNIDSVSDVLWALGGELDFNFVRFSDKARHNRVHPLNAMHVNKGVMTIPTSTNTNGMTSGIGGTMAVQSTLVEIRSA